MGENSKIEWCHHTFNPWIGCTKVSPGCANCYAEKSTRARVLRSEGHETWGKGAKRSLTSEANWKQPLKWNERAARTRVGIPGNHLVKIGTMDGKVMFTDVTCPSGGVMPPADWEALPKFRPRVFCASLSDWLDDEVPIEWLGRLLKLIRDTPHLDWLLLTKRPQNWQARLHKVSEHLKNQQQPHAVVDAWLDGHAPANVWIGTTMEDQTRADERIPVLLNIPATVRFLSCEPLLSIFTAHTSPWKRGESANRSTAHRLSMAFTGSSAAAKAGRMRDPCTPTGRGVCGISATQPACRSSSSSGAIGFILPMLTHPLHSMTSRKRSAAKFGSQHPHLATATTC